MWFRQGEQGPSDEKRGFSEILGMETHGLQQQQRGESPRPSLPSPCCIVINLLMQLCIGISRISG